MEQQRALSVRGLMGTGCALAGKPRINLFSPGKYAARAADAMDRKPPLTRPALHSPLGPIRVVSDGFPAIETSSPSPNLACFSSHAMF